MRKKFAFEKLEVWQDARRLAGLVYERTTAFPKTEVFGLTSQMRRAAISIANNLAEGSSGASLKDQARLSNQAYGSHMETASDLIIATDLGYLSTQQSDPLLNTAYDLAVRIHNLRASQTGRVANS